MKETLYKNKFKFFLDFSLKNDQNCQIPDVFKKTDKLPVSLNYISMVYLYTKNISAAVYGSVNICIHFVEFVHCVSVQKHAKAVSVS